MVALVPLIASAQPSNAIMRSEKKVPNCSSLPCSSLLNALRESRSSEVEMLVYTTTLTATTAAAMTANDTVLPTDSRHIRASVASLAARARHSNQVSLLGKSSCRHADVRGDTHGGKPRGQSFTPVRNAKEKMPRCV